MTVAQRPSFVCRCRKWPKLKCYQIDRVLVSSCLIVDHKRAVRVFKSCMGSQNRVVWLDNGRRHLGSGIDGKLELCFLAIINTKTGLSVCAWPEPETDLNRSIKSDVKPEPVPPPNEWKTRNPCSPEQLSASLRVRSNTLSMISLPTV